MMKRKKIVIIICIIIAAAVVYGYLSRKRPPPPARHGVPVLAGKVVQKTMPVIIEAIGTVEAYNSVTIYARIVGQLLRIHFKEGQDVKKGQPLFTIDPAPFQEKLRMSEAKLAQDIAQLKYNEDEAKRYAFLLEKGAVAASDYENKKTLALTQQATVRSSKADVDNARLNLEYCHIRSPLDGRTGAHLVKEGAMIKDNDTKLVVVNQVSPVYVKFSVPEKQLPEIRKYMRSEPLKVKASSRGARNIPDEGRLTFIDNAVDATTGMILLKAEFKNSDKFLWPGQFVNVVLNLTEEQNAFVVPAKAVQIGQKGHFVFVIKPDKKVELRNVAVSRTIGEETVISKGVSAGEAVVTDGHLKLKDGFPVEIRESLTPGSAEAPKKPAGAGEQTKGSPGNQK
ncbi:MAG: efflux RND transporter periplasmic adaptor subunit [Syntrophorhabdaceae bacterium]|nr:efflux RND transporter periplasmic adaptor subunit [Syntrophorhabdaceae bacterium]